MRLFGSVRLSGALALLVLLGASSRALASASEVERLVREMSSSDAGARGRANDSLQNLCLKAGRPGAESERAAVSQAMAMKLGQGTPKPARLWLLRQLGHIGRGECVGVLAKVLADSDEHIRGAACRALEVNPDPKAGAALRKALGGASDPKWLLALANSLGANGNKESAGAVAKLLGNSDKAVACAAAAALGKIGGVEAADALAGALAKSSGAFRRAVTDSYLLCADKFLAEGYKSDASKIYKKLYNPGQSETVRLAAMQGLAAVKTSKVPEKTRSRTTSTRTKRTTAGLPSEGSKASSGAVAKWDDRLKAQIKKALAAGKKPSFRSKKLGMRVKVTKMSASGGLWITATGGMQLGMGWSRIALSEKCSLATAVAGGTAEGSAVAAFYLLASGKSADAASYLRRAGDAAKEVQEAFK
ncbi:MAG: HEAT repeat domain-containing protein [Planctomycetota bacterium]|jgi:hypothetical protein